MQPEIEMKTQQDYQALQAELASVTNGHLYLADENVDTENCLHCVRDSAEFWDAMYAAACMAAGTRAEALGLDINAMLGRAIY